MSQTHRIASLLLFTAFAAYALFLGVRRPLHNWDMIGYVAAVQSFEISDVETLHRSTFATVRDAVTEPEYQRLTLGKGMNQEHARYRKAVATDAATFAEQLPLLRTRPVYIVLIFLLSKLGVPIVFATHLLSGFAVALTLFMLLRISWSFLALPFVYAVPLMTLHFGVLELARSSTPDGLACLAVIACACLFLERRFRTLCLLLPVVIGVRPDLLLLTIPLLACMLVLRACPRWTISLSILLSFGIYAIINLLCSPPSWATDLSIAMLSPSLHPISAPATMTLQLYLSILSQGSGILVTSSAFVSYGVFVALCLVTTVVCLKQTTPRTTLTAPPLLLAVVCCVYVVLHFLAFPSASLRFFSAAYLTGTLSCLALISGLYRQSLPNPAATVQHSLSDEARPTVGLS